MFFKNLQYLLSLFLLVALLTGAGFGGQQPEYLPEWTAPSQRPDLPEWGEEGKEPGAVPGNYWLEPDQARLL